MIVNPALEKVWIVAKAATWAIIGGGVTSVVTGFDDSRVYEGPPDWPHLRNVFISGAIVGLIGWYRKETALATPAPATQESDTAALKRAAEAADKSNTVIHIREVL